MANNPENIARQEAFRKKFKQKGGTIRQFKIEPEESKRLDEICEKTSLSPTRVIHQLIDAAYEENLTITGEK